MQQKLPDKLNERATALEKTILDESQRGNLADAKLVLNKLRPILEKYGQHSRLLGSYLYLYEGAMEAGDLHTAKLGFQNVRDRANKNTRRYLEATALLAISFVRENNLVAAEPLMHEVLINDRHIPSEVKREEFIAELVDRFNREGALGALSRVEQQSLDADEVHDAAIALVQEGLSEDDLEERLGHAVPQAVRDFIQNVDRVSRKALPPGDQLLLPPPRDLVRDRKIGDLVFRAVRKKLYPYICDEESEVYQVWVQKGLSAICDHAFVANVVVGALGNYKVLLGGVAIGVTALVIQNGLFKFCDAAKPEPFFSKRRK
jgi:hypothetical protein